MLAVQDAPPSGREPGELQRRLDSLRTAVAEVDAIQMRRLGQQGLGEQAGQRRRVELGEIGQAEVDDVVDRLPDNRIVASEGKNPEAGKHVEVVLAGVVVQVRALGARVDLVEADRVQHARQLGIQVPRVQLIALVAALLQERREVECRHQRRLSDVRAAGSHGRPPVRHRLATGEE